MSWEKSFLAGIGDELLMYHGKMAGSHGKKVFLVVMVK